MAGAWFTWELLKSCCCSFFCSLGSQTSYFTPALVFLSPTCVPGRKYTLSSILTRWFCRSWVSENWTLWAWHSKDGHADDVCSLCHSLLFSGGLFVHQSHLPTCELAAINLIFLGFPRFATMVADFINCLPPFMRGWGVISSLQKWKIQGGGGVLSEIPSVVGVWIFSGTTHCIILLCTHNNLLFQLADYLGMR